MNGTGTTKNENRQKWTLECHWCWQQIKITFYQSLLRLKLSPVQVNQCTGQPIPNLLRVRPFSPYITFILLSIKPLYSDDLSFWNKMAKQQQIRRRRTGSSSQPTDTSSTTEGTNTNDQPTVNTPKSVPELIDEERKSVSNFFSICAVVCLFFIHMIQNTPVPPPGRAFGIIIDAGSTGTRAQVFEFRLNPDTGHLGLHATKMFQNKQSIASLAHGATGSPQQLLAPLLDQVKKTIPGVRRRARTPIALHATAGLRLLGKDKSENILRAVRKTLTASEYLFKDEWASVLDEQHEGTFAWKTVNYLLREDRAKKGLKVDQPLAGALDLGGASMQLVYEDDRDSESVLKETEGKVDGKDSKENIEETVSTVQFLDKEYKLHSRSYLGLGIFDFTKKLYKIFDQEGVLEEGNPCFRKGFTWNEKKLRLGVPGSEESKTVNIVGDGDFKRCVASANIVLGSFSTLLDKRSALPSGKPFYAFAYFYDRTVKLGLSSKPTKEQLIAKGKELCESDPDVAVYGDFDEACAEFSYIFALLKVFTNDFQDELDVNIHFEQYVGNHMLGWALGAVLEVLTPNIDKQLNLESESLLIGT